MIAVLLLFAQVAAAETVATCRVPNDPQQRVWTLERLPSSWRIAFSSNALDKPRVELPVPLPPEGPGRTLLYASANGGRRIDWRINSGPSTLDLHVNHGLEVNVERDLDPAVELMNTDGPLAVICSTGGPPVDDRPTVDRRSSEWNVGAGAATSVRLFRINLGARVCGADHWLQPGVDARTEVDRHSRTVCVGRRSDADLRAIQSDKYLRRWDCAGGVAMEFPGWIDVVGVRGTVDGRDVDDGCDSGKDQPRQLHRALGRQEHAGAGAATMRYCSRIVFSISRTAISWDRIPA